MPIPKVIPWQSFFEPSVLTVGKLRAAEKRVQGLGHDPLEGSVHGEVTIRRTYVVTVHLAKATPPRSGQPLLISDIYFACECNRWELCEHAAAVLIAHTAANGYDDSDPLLIACGRDFVQDGHFIDGWSNDDEEEEEEEGDDAVDATPSTAGTLIPIPTSLRVASAPSILDHGEPPPAVTVASIFREDRGRAWEIDRWLNEQLPQERITNEHCFTYHLHRDSRVSNHWTVEVVLARRLKSGALGVHKRYRSTDTIGADELRRTSEEDRRIIFWLIGLREPNQRYMQQSSLSAASGVLPEAMKRLLATGRCFVENFAHPLAAGPTLAAEPAWVESEPGLWILAMRRADGVDIPVLPLDPPWYIADGLAGPLESEVLSQMGRFSRMPPVPTALLPAAIARLRERIPELPSIPSLNIAARMVPTGHLTPWRTIVSPLTQIRQRIPVELVLFGVQYGAVLSDPRGIGPITGADGQPILRDRSREADLELQLRQLGLVPVGELDERATKLGWSVPLSKQLPMRCWVCKAAVLGSDLVKPILMPPAIIGVLVSAGWTVTGSGPLLPALEAATIEARFHEKTDTPESGGNDWFQLDLGIRFGDERIDLTPIISALLLDPTAVGRLPQVLLDERTWACIGVPDGRVVRVPMDLLQRLVEHLTALFDAPPGATGWRTDPWQALSLEGIAGLTAINGPRLTDLAKRLAGLVVEDEAEPPATLLTSLRPYQKRGLAWLQRLRTAGTGGVLADDMGLGKTVQTIAHLCVEQAAGRLTEPALVIGPASLVGTWRRELARFAPHLTVAILHGGGRARTTESILEGRPQVVITTYATLLRAADQVTAITWSVVIADEAQAIGNPTVKSGQVVRRLKAHQRLALTGTPMSNHLGELHTLLSWLVPGLLGSAARFDQAFRRPIEKGGDAVRAGILRRRIAPFMLRRTKELVAPELPPRTETVITVELEGGQRALYESVRLTMDERIRAVIAAKGLAKSHIEVLEALTKLRLCCCDPRLVKSAERKGHEAGSAKLDWLRSSLPELIEEGRRILVFSQFTSWLDLIERDVLTPSGLSWLRLDGSTVDRDTPVQRFQRGEVPVFLLSLKAGGTGLTLTAADTVILTDPWWNPAAEDQAADRAHRIGQDKPVFIWRLVAEGTVEERILALQARKRALMSALLDDQGQSVPTFTEADLAALLAPLPD
jgi:superfamily II DNA or RNA helicase